MTRGSKTHAAQRIDSWRWGGDFAYEGYNAAKHGPWRGRAGEGTRLVVYARRDEAYWRRDRLYPGPVPPRYSARVLFEWNEPGADAPFGGEPISEYGRESRRRRPLFRTMSSVDMWMEVSWFERPENSHRCYRVRPWEPDREPWLGYDVPQLSDRRYVIIYLSRSLSRLDLAHHQSSWRIPNFEVVGRILFRRYCAAERQPTQYWHVPGGTPGGVT